jgi:glycosyltransferase involved in cell wall biosynthesis
MKELSRALKTRRHIPRQVPAPLFFHRLYRAVNYCLRRWPIPATAANRNKKTTVNHSKRVGYFIWQYPVLSQTFVQRELTALTQSGVSVFVVSDIPSDDAFPNESVGASSPSVECLHFMDENTALRYKRYFFLTSPLLCLRLFLYLLGHDYHGNKNFGFDKILFSKAVYLAGLMKENGITHIHSPWADNCALIALLASRLLRIPYSVQARAHDIHRRTYLCGLAEKLDNADFIITNTEYNASHIQALMGAQTAEKLHVIYNGLGLDQFQPNGRKNSSPVLRILSVARLIEQKGLIYLLKACKILRDREYSFTCEIIGGPESPLFMNYYVALKKLHRKLHLEDCVFFLGTQRFEQVLVKYREADIFILPSVIAEDGSRDITPNVLIEAMAMKLPVISTTVTGIPEIVENEVSGILVPPNDENALADAIIKLINDSNLRKQLGESARKRIEERFDSKKNIGQYIDLFSGRSKVGCSSFGRCATESLCNSGES